MAQINSKANGLAAQLAQVGTERGAEQGSPDAAKAGAGKTVGSGAGNWGLGELRQDFSLDAAMSLALGRATKHLNHTLAGEGLVVQLPQDGAQSAGMGAVQVAERETNRVLRTYDVPDFLRFYAAREKTNGVIVNGQV